MHEVFKERRHSWGKRDTGEQNLITDCQNTIGSNRTQQQKCRLDTKTESKTHRDKTDFIQET